MARMKPDTFDYHSTDSKGEERVYDALKKHLDDNWLVCHSWRWVRHHLNKKGRKNQGEGDFVLFHHEFGIIVIEVKGGTIEYGSDGKYYSNGNLIQNPEKQASDTKYDIVERLKEKKLNSQCWVNHCVWFPDIEWNGSYPPNLNSAVLFDKKALTDPETKLISLTGSAKPITDQTTITIIEKLLFSPFRIVKNLLLRIDDAAEELIRLTNQQTDVYDGLGLNSVLGVRGRAGTGKTLLATHKAVEFSKLGKKVLYLCSGKGLSEYLQEAIGSFSINVFTFQKYALYYLQKHYPMRIPIDFNGASDFEYILGAFTEVADENLDNYDVCIIDEAQDMRVELFDSLRNSFVGQGNFYYFYDPMQIAYSRNSTIKDPFQKFNDFVFTLNRNMRNTIEVSKASLNILRMSYTPERDFSAVAGETPKVILVDTKTGEAVRKEIIDLTIIQRIPKSFISILSMNGDGKSECGDNVDDIIVNTFRKFKGLDNKVIILVDVSYHHFVDEVYSRELYMAVTRSRYYVIIFVNNHSSPMKNEFCKKYKIAAPDAEIIINILKENRHE